MSSLHKVPKVATGYSMSTRGSDCIYCGCTPFELHAAGCKMEWDNANAPWLPRGEYVRPRKPTDEEIEAAVAESEMAHERALRRWAATGRSGK